MDAFVRLRAEAFLGVTVWLDDKISGFHLSSLLKCCAMCKRQFCSCFVWWVIFLSVDTRFRWIGRSRKQQHMLHFFFLSFFVDLWPAWPSDYFL